MISLHRSRAIVAAVPQEDGSVLVLDGGREVTLSAEAFASMYAPASVDEVRRIDTAHNGHGEITAGRIEAAVPRALPASTRRGRPKGKTGGRPPRPAAKVPAVPSHPRSPGPKSTKDWVLGRKLWDDGLTAEDIGKRLGCSGAGVLYHVRTERWPKRKTAKPGRKPKAGTLLKLWAGMGIYLHKFVGPDWSTDLHDHPKRFISIGLRGFYWEETPGAWQPRLWKAPWVRSFPATHTHRLFGPMPEYPCWTLVIVLRNERPWGFWPHGRWVPWRTYVASDRAEHAKSCP